MVNFLIISHALYPGLENKEISLKSLRTRIAGVITSMNQGVKKFTAK